MRNSSSSDPAPAGNSAQSINKGSVQRPNWRRVSPIATAYFAFDTLKQAVNLWPALVGLWAGGPAVRAFFWDYGIFLLVGFFLLFVFLDYWFFRFQEEADRVQLQRGVINRKRLTLYYDRVQQADISQPFYFRPFGLAILGLESAGSAQKEVDLPGLRFDDAEKLKGRILDYRKSSSRPGEAAGSGLDSFRSETPEFQMTLPLTELARYGLMHNGLLFLLPLSAPFWEHFDIYARYLDSYLQDSAVRAFLQEFFRQGAAPIAVALMLALVAGLVLLFALSVLIGVVRFWDYQLVGGRDQYQYRAGLLTVKTRGFRLHKLQKVTITQGLFARWLKRYSLSISKAGGVNLQQEEDVRNFFIPVLDRQRLEEIKRRLELPEVRWTRVNRYQFVFRGFVKGILFGVSGGVLLMNFTVSPVLALLAALVLFLLCNLASRRYWRRFGYYRDENWLVIRYGFIGQTLVYVPSAKVQKIQLSQPPWIKWLGLAHLVIWSGSGKVRVPYLPCSIAATIRNNLMRSVVTFRGRWF